MTVFESFGALKPTRLGGFGGFGGFGAFPGCQTEAPRFRKQGKKFWPSWAQWFAHWQWLHPEAYKAWTEQGGFGVFGRSREGLEGLDGVEGLDGLVLFWRAKWQVLESKKKNRFGALGPVVCTLAMAFLALGSVPSRAVRAFESLGAVSHMRLGGLSKGSAGLMPKRLLTGSGLLCYGWVPSKGCWESFEMATGKERVHTKGGVRRRAGHGWARSADSHSYPIDHPLIFDVWRRGSSWHPSQALLAPGILFWTRLATCHTAGSCANCASYVTRNVPWAGLWGPLVKMAIRSPRDSVCKGQCTS